ncbi:Cell cycle checkpoint protein RAD17 [Lonchura striata]|uniref:Cell cycle checkpoint protein RAD17 n=1 Tax=Lonchura striata TaxID=40157 RepID=A0A218V155_9PASE|nr:Cell cycle checkpoint protein RAD17 [Lonchura striata domestica]
MFGHGLVQCCCQKIARFSFSDSNSHTFPSQAQAALFQDFLLRANKYNKLQMLGESSENDKKLILIESVCGGEGLHPSVVTAALCFGQDIPNQFYRDPGSLHEILRSFVRRSRCPLVFIISDNFSGDSNQRSLFPAEIVEELCIFNISFKPVAPTNMMKVLTRIAAAEASMNRENYAPDRTSLELLCRGCSGDIRSAINSLQFSSTKGTNSSFVRIMYSVLILFFILLIGCSLEKEFWSKKKKKCSTIKCEEAGVSKVRKKSKCDTSEDQEMQAIGGKDASIFLFHALGKIIYCKREAVSEAECPQLPAHLSRHHRDTLLIQPEVLLQLGPKGLVQILQHLGLLLSQLEIVEKSHMSGSMFNLYLHQNYVDFFSDIDDVVKASEYLSTADVLCSNWSARLVMESYGASVATRGVIHSNTSRAFAHQQGGMGFRPLHKPQWFLINKKYQENCIAAKSLFSSFCLPPECLQTELLPYLAMLANPMRNQGKMGQAQIAFIQDVGRLPLKRHFGRLELLTAENPGVSLWAAVAPHGLRVQPQMLREAVPCSACRPAACRLQLEALDDRDPGLPELHADPEGLPCSQSSGSDLPGSQPQPVAAQALLEEEELRIEEYDSD